uniref:Uncharacterized protein n=1 Tax=Oryza glumipatula TaxID=40148 RepID=A0A0E0AAB5_9ORYZ
MRTAMFSSISTSQYWRITTLMATTGTPASTAASLEACFSEDAASVECAAARTLHHLDGVRRHLDGLRYHLDGVQRHLRFYPLDGV